MRTEAIVRKRRDDVKSKEERDSYIQGFIAALEWVLEERDF